VHQWLTELPVPDEVVVIGASQDATNEAIRAIARERGSTFGHHRFTLGRLAVDLAKYALAERGLAPIGALPFQALCARVVDRLRHEGKLVRLGPVADQPGLPAALARTLDELRQAGATTVDGDPDLTHALGVLDEELATSKLADRTLVFRLATEAARGIHVPASPLLGLHLVLIDVPVRTRVEEQLLAALVARAPTAFATSVTGDDSTLRLATILETPAVVLENAPIDSLSRVQRFVFSGRSEPATLDETIVRVMSAPGENRECVEIARCLLAEAQNGTPFDRMAVLLRSPEHYRAHLEEALGRAKIPAHFAQGTRLPDPAGRAFLALLACGAEELSARRFAEYLSLGEVPDASVNDAPPPAAPSSDRWVPPDEELAPLALAPMEPEDYEIVDEDHDTTPLPSLDAAVLLGTLRAPWRWERLLHDAAVIGGRDRWQRRIDGLEEKLRRDAHEDETSVEYRDRQLADLAALRSFALPLLDDLAALPFGGATWRTWIDHLSALATRALRDPSRVIGVLANLTPMAEIGPVTLTDVRSVLEERLTELMVKPTGARYGRLLVTTVEAARGLAFDVVFVPGLAEKMFPQKLSEDPLLLDAIRNQTGLPLRVERHRIHDERLALHIAVGAATKRLVLSYPRVDLEKGRPRVPSFYGLEVLQAAEGTLTSFEDLGKRADATGAARIGWPAPASSHDAIDEAEHDLAVLDPLVHTPQAPKGAARYLLEANTHLARTLRARARRWAVKDWKSTDGLVIESAAGKAALALHVPSARSFSPTALEQLAACPYKFALRTILKLEPRKVPAPVESLDALERGSLIHQVQYELLGQLKEEGQLPVRASNLEVARDRLDTVLARVEQDVHDRLAPAIDRVWRDGIKSIKADLREWLRRIADDSEWIPTNFELAFGLPGDEGRDPASVDDPLALDIGIQLRGSIDLVERGPDGSVRATDHKTGKAKVAAEALIAGGSSLQPILYALALEKLFPGTDVMGGRLYYCTTRGDFQVVTVRLDVEARNAATTLATTLASHFEAGFFPAAPRKDECRFCDYRPICGPYEEQRAAKKKQDRLVQLKTLREVP